MSEPIFRFDLSIDVQAPSYDEAMELLEFKINYGGLTYRDFFIAEITEVG
jgi:hypothetical protein